MQGFSRWSQAGSNRRPPGCDPGALPAELWPRAANSVAAAAFTRLFRDHHGSNSVSGKRKGNRKGDYVKLKQLLPLLAAGLVTVLVVAGFSQAKSSAAPVNTAEPIVAGTAK